MNVGIAQVDYTPPVGLPLLGNYREDYASRGVHDPLMAKAIVISDTQGTKIAMLSIDICMLDRDNVRTIRQFIAANSDIRWDNILVASTHTHSAAAAIVAVGVGEIDKPAVQAFLQKAAGAVLEADKNLQPSELSVGYSREDRVSFNRRLKCSDGQTHMNWEALDADFVVEPLGPIDPEVTVLCIGSGDSSRACAVNFALHPAILAGDNWLYSADYPGCLAEAVGRILPGPFATLFFTGCCGDVNHIDYRDPTQGRGFQMAQRVGYMLAVAACEAMHGASAVQGSSLAVSTRQVTLERVKISDDTLQWCRQVLADADQAPAAGQVDGLPDEFFARRIMGLYDVQHQPDAVEVMAIRIGDLAVVGLPGEVFCELGMEIKRQSPATHTMVIELANDAIGYLPTPEAFDQGGYEPMPGSTKYQPDAGGRLVASALEQLNELFQQ